LKHAALLSVLIAVVLVGALPGPAASRSTRVDRARYSVEGERTRIVLDVSAACDYKISNHKNPDRIAINLPGSRAGKSLKPLDLDKGVVDRVRVNRLSWGVQVVLDLSKPAAWKDFRLTRNKKYPNRIVLDVFDAPTRRARSNSGKPRPRTDDLYIIAIDPGHGGKDFGTSKVEKTLTLDIGKRIVHRINQLDGFKAVLTRDRDVYLRLKDRVDIAASKQADVFVSIHVNWAPNRSARGAEIFFVSPRGAKATTSRVLANPRRAADELGLTGSHNKDLLHMLVDVNQQAVMTRSEQLAESILESLSKKDLPPTRSVKQKSFEVLRTIEMPSVLVETGFISNRHDARLLQSKDGRQRVAEAVANGIVAYFFNFPPPRGRRDPGKPAVVVHKVKRGESLWKISRRYGTTVASLQRANNLDNSSVLRVGQELIVTNRY
jgi:N-acetylmuramoyl-L-alanine amidase